MLDPLRAMSRPNSEFLLRVAFPEDSPYSCGFTAEIWATLKSRNQGLTFNLVHHRCCATARKMLLLPPPDSLQVLCLLL
jgi:hypothetical protein